MQYQCRSARPCSSMHANVGTYIMRWVQDGLSPLTPLLYCRCRCCLLLDGGLVCLAPSADLHVKQHATKSVNSPLNKFTFDGTMYRYPDAEGHDAAMWPAEPQGDRARHAQQLDISSCSLRDLDADHASSTVTEATEHARGLSRALKTNQAVSKCRNRSENKFRGHARADYDTCSGALSGILKIQSDSMGCTHPGEEHAPWDSSGEVQPVGGQAAGSCCAWRSQSRQAAI